MISSSKATNEENYLMGKFARQVLGTKNIDNCARLCHSSTVAALQQTLGYGAMTNRINEDIGEADAYLISGSNTTESHPVLATRIKQNVRDGADLVVFDPRKVGIAEHADQYTRTNPGYDVAWLNGLIRYIVTNDHVAGNAAKITVSFPDGRELPGTLVGTDPESDIALVKVEPDAPLPYLAFTESEDLFVGEWAVALGNPFGLFEAAEPTVTVGVVSAVRLLCEHGSRNDRQYDRDG